MHAIELYQYYLSLICFTYESNVNSLFTSLISSASISSFNKFEISPQSDAVYGLFQCRGDLSYHDCKDCVENSVSQLKKTCPKSTSGTIQFEGCFIKYDNTSFFGVEDKLKVFKRCGPSIGYNSDTLTRIDDALAYLVGKTGQYFRVGVLGSVQDCALEARGRVRSECETSTWGDMYLGKCYIRYADGSFRPVKGKIELAPYVYRDAYGSIHILWFLLT
ncbi:putative Gnk2-like domain-containing protein [Helianthus anomalus]